MVQRLLISGDNPETVATIRRIAEEGGLTVTSLDNGGGDDAPWDWRDDHAAYERQREQLGEQYAGRHIAMYRGDVVGVGQDRREAARRGLERVGRAVSLFVIAAGEPLPQPEELETRMDAPRGIVAEQ